MNLATSVRGATLYAAPRPNHRTALQGGAHNRRRPDASGLSAAAIGGRARYFNTNHAKKE